MPPFPIDGSATTQTQDPMTQTTVDPQQKGMVDADTPLNPYDINDPKAVKQVKKRRDERWKVAGHRRWLFELKWLRNVLFQLSIQWVRIDYAGKEIRNLSLPTNFPRAITNKYAKVNNDIWGKLIAGDIPVNWMPGTERAEDISTAGICERLREVVDEETHSRSKKRDLGFWTVQTGNAFILPWYDYSEEYGVVPVPMQQCDGCGLQSLPGQ